MLNLQKKGQIKSILERRNRNGLKVDTAIVQKGWEQKQVLKALAVHGPFKPLLLTKEKMRSLSTNEKNDTKNNFANVDDINQQNDKVKRRRSGFWRLVNGCFGGGQPNKHPTKPCSPKSVHAHQVDQSVPIVSPHHQNILQNSQNEQVIPGINEVQKT